MHKLLLLWERENYTVMDESVKSTIKLMRENCRMVQASLHWLNTGSLKLNRLPVGGRAFLDKGVQTTKGIKTKKTLIGVAVGRLLESEIVGIWVIAAQI